jgi:acetyltransferase-like isoleucine patch superfamily enzyme
MGSFFVHKNGICESKKVGDGTNVRAYARVLSGAKIGSECNICDHVFIENDVTIGNKVTIKNGVEVWNGIRIGDDVFIGPGVTFANDNMSRSKESPDKFLKTVIENGASIGANANIRPGIRIGSKAIIGAGAVVLHDVPSNAIVAGNPARISGYVHTQKSATLPACDRTSMIEQGFSVSEPQYIGVGDSKIWLLPRFKDLRGDLVPIEFDQNLPFTPQRQFFVFAVQGHKIRGEHAHKKCDQFLLAVSGALSVVVDNTTEACEVRLSSPDIGLFMPAGIWGIQYKFSEDAVLAVYASEPYDTKDYIRSYDEYKEYVVRAKNQE